MGLDFGKAVEDFANGNTKESTNFEPIPAGEYEVNMTCEKKPTKDGTDTYINCAFTVRKDVEGQEYGGRMIFDGIYKSKKTGEYLESKIGGILFTINNHRTKFDNYDEFIQYVNDTNMIIDVEIKKADQNYTTKDKNVVKYLSYKPSKVSPADDKEKTQALTGAELKKSADDISGDDLPF